MKLGRKFPTKSKLKLANYLGVKLPPPPPSVDWSLAFSDPAGFGMMANDKLGDCTCAAMGHSVQIVTSNGDGLITPTDDDIVKAYEVVGGYNPADPNTDQGATELAAMQYMVDHGLAGVKCDAFADVDYTNIEAVKQAISLMGGVYIGVVITQQDMDDFGNNVAWQDLNTDNVLGGHALWVPAYDADGLFPITWGKKQPATWAWYQAKCDEAHVLVIDPWVHNSVNCSPDGFNYDQIMADVKAL